MKYALYRRMSLEEAEKTLSSQMFFKPENQVFLPRKWFSTSILRTHYFKNPFYNGESVVVKVEVNEDYFCRIFEEGEFLKKEPNGFYGYDDSQKDILFARAHKTIDALYNIGILDLDTFNQQFDEVVVIGEDAYCDYITNAYLGKPLESFVEDVGITSPLDFYVQVSFDVAVLSLKYQTIMPEGINPILKEMHFSKNKSDLKKQNLDKFKVTLLVRFKEDLFRYSKYHEMRMSMDSPEVIKFSSLVDSISLVELLPCQEEYKDFLQIVGDNLYTKHSAKSFSPYSRLPFGDFQSITSLLFQKNFAIEDVLPYIPELSDLEGIQQVDPKHIDSLKTHVEKVVRISNLVINYYKDQGLEIDTQMLVYLKWVLFLHDLGKPYCSCEKITSRYSQFGDRYLYADTIASQLLDPDIAFPVGEISKIFRSSSLIQQKKIKYLVHGLLKEIQEFYHSSLEEAYDYLHQYLQVALMAKVSHTASLKTRSFCSSYVDDLQFFDRMSMVLTAFQDDGYVFSYDDYFSDFMGAYSHVVEEYYVPKKQTILDSILAIRQKDYQDLKMVYDSKMEHVHSLDDDSMYCFDTLIDMYFKEDDPLVQTYFLDLLSSDNAHGELHEQKVMVFSFLLGRFSLCTDEDIEILLLASKYHDHGRKVSCGLDHGFESVNILKEEGILDGYSYREYVYALIEAHAYPDDKDVSILSKYDVDIAHAQFLLALLKDADALDRVRYDTLENYGSRLNAKYLRSEVSQCLIKFAYLYNASVKENKKELAPSLKQLLKSN